MRGVVPAPQYNPAGAVHTTGAAVPPAHVNPCGQTWPAGVELLTGQYRPGVAAPPYSIGAFDISKSSARA